MKIEMLYIYGPNHYEFIKVLVYTIALGSGFSRRMARDNTNINISKK